MREAVAQVRVEDDPDDHQGHIAGLLEEYDMGALGASRLIAALADATSLFTR